MQKIYLGFSNTNYNKCVYEQDTAQRTLNDIKERMDAVETAAAANGTDCRQSASYQELAAIQSTYDEKIESLNTRNLDLKQILEKM